MKPYFSSEQKPNIDPLSNQNEDQLKMIQKYMLKISQQMEKAKIMEYTELLSNPRRIIWVNLIGGIARGVGIAIGFTIVTALLVYFLRYLGALNLPLIGDFIADIVTIVQRQLESKFH